MRTTTDIGTGHAIAAAAKEGFIGADEARKIAEILEDAAVGMEIEANEGAAFGRKQIVMRRADLLMAISDEIDEALGADGHERDGKNTEVER